MRSFLAWFSLWLACPALSEEPDFLFRSVSAAADYGVLVMAPETDCAASRVVLRTDAGEWKSATLAPGQLSVVRIGHGFAPGDHGLTVTVLGCDQPAHVARRVVLGKLSPDHGWRASGALQ